MSRYTLPGKKSGHTVAFGIDPVTSGWFFQLFSPEECDTPIIDKDTASKGELCNLIDKHADDTLKVTKYVLGRIAFDYEPDIEVYRTLRKSNERA